MSTLNGNRMTRKGYRSSINAPKFAPSEKRNRQEEALDEALENTFPASDPVSVEQPTTTGAPVVPHLKI